MLAEVPVSEHSRVLLRLANQAPEPRLGQPLNIGQPWFGKGRDAEQARKPVQAQQTPCALAHAVGKP